jgi:uncharacterized protein YoxC
LPKTIETLAVTEKLVSVADKLFAGLRKFEGRDQKDREKVATLLDQIADAIAEVSNSFEELSDHNNACARVHTYSGKFKELVLPVLGVEMA